MTGRPEYLQQGESARLFPVLATTSKEGRTTSILLACLGKIDGFGKSLLKSTGQNLGKRAVIETFTEIVFRGEKLDTNDRPDGLIVVRVAGREWRALVESKVGNNRLDREQIERYRTLARDHKIDCVITISNQFATSPNNHPLEEVRKSRSKIPVFHWSWMYILTTADLLLNNNIVPDRDQALLLEELRRFLSHDSAGVKGFDRMPAEWTELNRLVSAGGSIPAKSTDAKIVLEAWHQETKDLALILSRQTETSVSEKLSRSHLENPHTRLQDENRGLRELNNLKVHLNIPGAAASLEICADLSRRTIDVGMTIKAPKDRKSSSARLNWLVRQIKTSKTDDLHIRLNWPGRSSATQFLFSELLDNPSSIQVGKEGLQVYSFHVFFARRLGPRFIQQANFITDLEKVVPEFYVEIGQFLSEWRKSPPKIKPEKITAEDVSTEAMSGSLNGVEKTPE